MIKCELLDCTLRDGGYYTNWDFSDEIVEAYFDAINNLPIDYIEIGYRSKELDNYFGKFFYLPEHVLKSISEKTNKKLVIILNEKDVRVENVKKLLLPCKSYIHTVRLAVDPENFSRALGLAKEIKRLGYYVCFNLMYMSKWRNDTELISKFSEIDGVIDILYMVDSFGSVYPEDVKSTYKLIKEKSNVKVGFHGHNNLELGLINTLTAIDCGVDIVDTTITGMGRGAGNLSTELLLTVLQSKGLVEVDFNVLSKVLEVFTKLKENYKWGTNLPYMVSGAHSLPQKNVMDWMSKKHYPINAIVRALENEFEGAEDNHKLVELKIEKKESHGSILLVGGGDSVVTNEEVLNLFLTSKPDITIIHASSKNASCFKGINNSQYFCLIGNEGYRLEKVFKTKEDVAGVGVLPPYPRKMGTYIPKMMESKAYELPSSSLFEGYEVSHTSIALQLANQLGHSEIFIVGYDGYNNENMDSSQQELFVDNSELFQIFQDLTGKKLLALTPTKYKILHKGSIFNKI